MKILLFLLSTILIGSIFSTTTTQILDRTMLSANYLDKKAQSVNLYQDLAPLLKKNLKIDSSIPAKQKAQMETVVNQASDPVYLQQKTKTTLESGERFIRQGGELPKLDISDLLAKNNIQVDASEFKTVYTPSEEAVTSITQGFKKFDQSKKISLYTTLGLILLLLIISILSKRFGTMIYVFVASGLLMLAAAFGARRLAVFAQDKIASSELRSSEFTPIVERLTTALVKDLTTYYIEIGIACLVVAAIIFTVSRFIKPVPTKTA